MLLFYQRQTLYDIGSSSLKFHNIFATTFNGAFQGTANFADALSTARDFSATGDITAAAVSFNGTGNVNLVTSLAASGVTAGTYGNSTGHNMHKLLLMRKVESLLQPLEILILQMQLFKQQFN